jgi:RNA polymerase sigma-70 factor (ECF subfamily)
MPTETAPELDAILADLRTALASEPAPAVSRRRFRPRRRLVLALPLVLAIAAALLVGLGVGHAQPAAARELRDAAKLVAGTPAPVIGPGQYWYVKGVGAFANGGVALGPGSAGRSTTFVALQSSSHEIWIANDASGRVVREDGPPQFFSAAERARWEAAGKPGFGPDGGIDSSEGAGALSWGWESLGVHSREELPTDPTALAALVERSARGTKNPLPYEEFQLIAAVLRFAPLSGAQTAAFYEVLATLPGIQLVGPTRDSLGRPGTAFAVERGDPTRDELILDPSTGRLLGSRTTLTSLDPAYPGAPAGTVLGYETIVSTGVVDSTDARPT